MILHDLSDFQNVRVVKLDCLPFRQDVTYAGRMLSTLLHFPLLFRTAPYFVSPPSQWLTNKSPPRRLKSPSFDAQHSFVVFALFTLMVYIM